MIILYGFNVALAGTLAAAAALLFERVLFRRAVAVRHGLLLVSLIVVALVPFLAYLGPASGIGILPALPPSASAPRVEDAAFRDVIEDARLQPKRVAGAGELDAPAIHVPKSASAWPIMQYVAWTLLGIVAGGMILRLGKLLRAKVMLHRLCSTNETSPALQGLLSSSAHDLELRKVPEVRWSPLVPSPLVAGALRPCVFLPVKAAELSQEQLQAVLLHEFAHIARKDHWIALIESFVHVAFWWCPPVLILTRRLGDLREQLCDAHVVCCQGDGLHLASALLMVCEWSVGNNPRFGAVALGAAGRSAAALHIRIESLVQQENIPMIRMNTVTRLALGAAGIVSCIVVTVAHVSANESSPGARAPSKVALSPTVKMLSADDFWATTGAATKHKFDPATIDEVKKLAESSDSPVIRIRAYKLLCDLVGHTHIVNGLSDADAGRAIAISFEHLETHLADPAIAKYSPQAGFSYLTVGSKRNDGSSWLLMETVGPRPSFNGGLNILFDLKASKVEKVDHWGDIRPGK